MNGIALFNGIVLTSGEGVGTNGDPIAIIIKYGEIIQQRTLIFGGNEIAPKQHAFF